MSTIYADASKYPVAQLRKQRLTKEVGDDLKKSIKLKFDFEMIVTRAIQRRKFLPDIVYKPLYYITCSYNFHGIENTMCLLL